MDQNLLKDCTLCPRECHVDRLSGKMGYCRETADVAAARAALHMWEEPCISGEEGSGTVFFSGCAMGCVYCQNHNIADGTAGKKITIERLSDIYLELQAKGANNINLVTPSHYVPQIIEAIILARQKGLRLPIVYNCSGYEKVETLRLLEGYVDIYLPDLKYMDPIPAAKYSNCKDYFIFASKAIEEMVRQVGKPSFDERGMMEKGVIVRHLTLPGYLKDSKNIIKYLYDTYGDTIYISIMNQYTPLLTVSDYPELNRKITEEEYEELIDYAIELGVENGFIQEGETASESFIPEFNEEGV
jgi:putative pyruvate formate lyase activating enzyme